MRATATLTTKLERNLIAYATAASAAGIGIVSAAQPAEAKVVYTPAYVVIGDGHPYTYDLDVNNDGITDFHISKGFSCDYSSCYYFFGGFDNRGSGGIEFGGFLQTCWALPRGKTIDNQQRFNIGWAAMAGVIIDSHSRRFERGNWINVKHHYLGLTFTINNESHFGWARFTVSVNGSDIVGTLTGYAYETIPNKSIIAGNRGSTTGQGPEDEPVSLGRLALGAAGRKQHQPSRAYSH